MRKLAIVASLILLLSAWWVLARSPAAPERTPRASEPASEIASAPPPSEPIAAAPSPAPAPAETRSEAAPEPEVAPPPIASASSSVPSTTAIVRGRLLVGAGRPAGGVAIALHGWQANQERVLQFGLPENWQDPQTTTSGDGTFELRIDPPPAFQFFLEAKLAGWVTASWRWSEIAAGSVRDLGDTTLAPAGTIVGRVVDVGGKPVPGAWTVYAEGVSAGSSPDAEAPRAIGRADAATAEFRIEGAPPGTVHLKANLGIVGWIDGPGVDVRAGETVNANVVYSGPDFSQRITVVVFSQPFYVFDCAASSITLSGAGSEKRVSRKDTRSSQSYVFDDLPPGRYTVSIDDPNFGPWSRAGVSPGTRVDAQIRGAAAVELAVVDATTKQPIERYGVRVRFEHANFSPNEFELFDANAPPPPRGRVDGLIPREQTIVVRAPGYTDCELRVDGLVAGEVRALTAELRSGARLAVTVVAADGSTPAPNVDLTLELERKSGEQDSNFGFESSDQRKATSDASGRAELADLPAGRHTLVARRTVLVSVRAEVVVAADSAQLQQRLVLPAVGELRGRLIAQPRLDPTSLSIAVEPTGMSEDDRWELEALVDRDPSGAMSAVATDGSFHIGPLPAQTLRVRLQLPQVMVPTQHGATGLPGPSRVIGEIAIRAGAPTEQEFDVTSFVPGSVELRVTRAGKPLEHAIVTCLEEQSEAGESGGACALLDANGEGRTGPLFAGRVRATVRDKQCTWQWTSPREIEIRSGATVRVDLEVELTEGALTLVDAGTQKPFEGRQVQIVPREPGGSSASVTTDAHGRVALALTPGKYLAIVMPQMDIATPERTTRQAEFEWTAPGPVELTLSVR